MDIPAGPRLCALEAPKRNHYFYGKLLDEWHLRLEQDYLNRKRWMVNRLALGYGVLCGLQVSPGGRQVAVEAGVAIDGHGREIVVPGPVRVDASKIVGADGARRDRQAGESPVYLWLCYRECKADFEPALVADCGPEPASAPSTIVEGYRLELRTEVPPAIAAEDEALCKALREGADAEGVRRLVTEALQRECVCREGDGCVPLARVELDADGAVTVVDRAPQPRAYSNETLFKLLMCARADGQPGGPGPQGPPGLGLNPDLPKIIDVAWTHDAVYSYLSAGPARGSGSFLLPFLNGDAVADRAVLERRLRTGETPPLFTVYFNRPMQKIDDQTFTVRLQYELVVPRGQSFARLGFCLDTPLAGEILEQPGDPAARTPHTQEPYAYAATFVPRIEVFSALLPTLLALLDAAARRLDQATLARATMQIKLKGDFLFAGLPNEPFDEARTLDADNIGGQVGVVRGRGGPITGGANPSGNLTQGGDFESWLRVTLTERDQRAPQLDEQQLVSMAHALRNRPEDLPVNVNLATPEQLEGAGLSASQVGRLLEARREGRFEQVEDLRSRGRLSQQALRSAGNRLIVY